MFASYKLWLAISKILTPVKGSTKGSILIIWSSSSYLFFRGSLGISSESESSFTIGILPISWFESALRLLFLVPFVANLSMLIAARWSSSSRCLAMLTFSFGFFYTLTARSFGYIGTEPRWESRLYLKRGRRSYKFSTFFPDSVGCSTSRNSSSESESFGILDGVFVWGEVITIYLSLIIFDSV